jgi:hypothetical protein
VSDTPLPTPGSPVPAEAVTAAANAMRKVGLDTTDHSLRVLAEAALAAAAPVLYAAAEPKWHCTRDGVTVPCGECSACKRDHADAYLAGAAAEQERCIQLAKQEAAKRSGTPNQALLWFADLLAAAPDSASERPRWYGADEYGRTDPDKPMSQPDGRGTDGEEFAHGRAAERKAIADDLQRRADEIRAIADSDGDPDGSYRIVANTLGNTAWALEHRDDPPLNLCAPQSELR